jgi:hypothetical protein
MTSTQKWPIRKRPLDLAEVLRLRNGIELPKKILSGFNNEKTLKITKSDVWPLFSLN